jgi:hypothetical protein
MGHRPAVRDAASVVPRNDRQTVRHATGSPTPGPLRPGASSAAGSNGHRAVPREASNRTAEAAIPDAISATRRSARRASRRVARVVIDRAMKVHVPMRHVPMVRVTTVPVPVVLVTLVLVTLVPVRIPPVGIVPVTTARVPTAHATTFNVPVARHRQDSAATGSPFMPVRARTTTATDTPRQAAAIARSKTS